ncbi:MAG: ATP-binding protein, partial [Bacteroidota bacterium]
LGFAFYRFQLNRQLAEAEANKFREIDEVKSRLYTNITHEFRTPLTIIDGLTDQIKGFDKLRHIIKRNTGQLLNLVNQLLDLAKMEEGKLSIDYIQADVIPFIYSVSDTFNNVAEAKNIHFVVSSELRELYMDFDKEKLQHILTNLLSNALKFTPEGGKVELMTDKPDESHIRIQIKDSGIGISEEKLPHIFNRFYQGDQSDTRKWEGTGIGLALVKELTQLLDGKIEVVSNETSGTLFSVTLPIMNEAPLTEIATIAPTFTVANSHVTQKENFILSLEPQAPRALIVEDNEDVIFYLKTQLSKSYQLIVARNGKEGIDRAVNLIPDIIISDVMMPEVDGLELCQTLKNNPHTSHIPIILLTAKGDLESKISGLSKGADAYLPKPFNQRELEIRLEQLIASRKKMQQQFSTGKWGEIELPQNPQLRQEYEFLKKVTDYIEANIGDENLSVPQIASAVNMERSQLYRKVNQLTGHSPSYLLKQLRLQKAHELLVHSSMNVSEIAFECGFKELPSLSRNYKAYFGKTPTEERKARKPNA